ncbi:PAS domain S-box protein [Polaromonas sp. UC242_47]|uniref:PAS domain S-box protein n=1 Tax=Polaromonas sp. UC242_47 TaxID=3374626 RepID=UPI0037C92960
MIDLDLETYQSLYRLAQQSVELRIANEALQQKLNKSDTLHKNSEKRFRVILESLADAVILRDADGRIIDCNASAERLFGRTLSQMRGATSVGSDWQIFRENGTTMPVNERPSVAARRTGLPQANVLVRYRNPCGIDVWCLINVQPLFEESPTVPSGFVSTITDVSKVKRGEIEIAGLNVELENRVVRRTAQLHTAIKELEAFSYSVAHDLRSPLTSIDGFCTLLEKSLPSEIGQQSIRYLSRVREGVRHMGALTDGLLSLAHISRTSVTLESINLSVVASDVIRALEESGRRHFVEVTVEPDMLVIADKALLHQALQNLIGNAWKFTSKKSVAKIKIGEIVAPDLQTVFFVRDNGAGFDMAYADKLFGAFQRLHSVDEFSGTGIGLATVHRIISRHRGKIWADAAVGEGCTFYFTLGAQAAPKREGYRNAAVERISYSAGRQHHMSDTTGDSFSISAGHFTNMFEHSPIGMSLIGLDSRGLRFNKVFCQMLGYSEAEMLARTVQEISHRDDIETDFQLAKRALTGEIETFQTEKRYIHKSGQIIWAHVTSCLVRDSDRKPVYFVRQIQNISDRKLEQAELIDDPHPNDI